MKGFEGLTLEEHEQLEKAVAQSQANFGAPKQMWIPIPKEHFTKRGKLKKSGIQYIEFLFKNSGENSENK